MDDETKKIILSYLIKWKSTRVSKDKLQELKEELMAKPEAKPVPLTTLKKWVRKVVKETSQGEKIKALQAAEGHVSPITTPVSEGAFQRSTIFDLAASKKAIERMINSLTEIKKQSEKQPKQFRLALSSEVTFVRKEVDRLASRLHEIEKQLIAKSEKR